MDLEKAFVKDFKLWLCFIGTGNRNGLQTLAVVPIVLFGVNDNKYLIKTKLSEKKTKQAN